MMVLLSKTGYWRKDSLRVRTDIIKEKNKLYVKKTALGDESKKILKTILEAYVYLKKNLGREVEIARPIKELKDAILFDFCKGQNLEKIIETNLIERKFQEVLFSYKKGLEIIDMLPSYKSTVQREKKFADFFHIEKKYHTLSLDFLYYPFSEIPADHILVHNNKYSLIDYEIFFDSPIPKKYLFFRYQFHLLHNLQQVFTALAGPEFHLAQYLKNLHMPAEWLPIFSLTKTEKELFLGMEEENYGFMNWQTPNFKRLIDYSPNDISQRAHAKFTKGNMLEFVNIKTNMPLPTDKEAGEFYKRLLLEKEKELDYFKQIVEKITSAKFYKVWQFYCDIRDKFLKRK